MTYDSSHHITTDQPRYEPRIADETLYLKRDDHSLEIDSMKHIVKLAGGETYTIEYTDQQTAAAWLDTDDENAITFDVREVVGELPHTPEFATNLENAPLEETTDDGHSKRTSLFVDHFTEILDSKGNLDA
ncbi:hypothetical protein [Natrinema amylolyticum]|uniref:hypothetical protein n=1 Tax=Natrinema amylolyticum TaxID=2878679 RepID=UPI001CFA8C0D|nr:hypothetical protein [Natrinema amylolyticum]